MAGEAQRNGIPGPVSLLGTRKVKSQQSSTPSKTTHCRRTRLQIHSSLSVLERYQGQIKLFHFTSICLWTAKEIPRKFYFRGAKRLAGLRSSADCLRHSAEAGAEFAARAVAVVQRQPLHSRGPSVAALSQLIFFLRVPSANSPSIVPASAPFAAWPR